MLGLVTGEVNGSEKSRQHMCVGRTLNLGIRWAQKIEENGVDNGEDGAAAGDFMVVLVNLQVSDESNSPYNCGAGGREVEAYVDISRGLGK